MSFPCSMLPPLLLRLPSTTISTRSKTLLRSHFSVMAQQLLRRDDETDQSSILRHQNVVVMRHGDRIDNFVPRWIKTAARPWDPPLVEEGRVRAFCTGAKLRSDLGFPIHRVFVSPFVRCVETAAQVVTALCAVETPTLNKYGLNLPVDPSALKVSIEYGLCEMLNREAIRGDVAPKDGNWGFDIPELEATFPEGTVDRTVQRVYKEVSGNLKLPQWGESVKDARLRYASVVQALADKHPAENLLLVTHGEGVGASISNFLEGATVHGAEYCSYSNLRRPFCGDEQSSTAGEFQVMTNLGQTGVSYTLPA